ncbi:MAG TPA: FGGY family carbohydrate kinase, partial [Capsulimonadaceae bacterium]|nr:FGGY family carbohydrate kinase [Capsulimonadaceae bacterium]
ETLRLMGEYLLAFDLGTTGNKAALVEASTGRIAATALSSYSTYYTENGGAEQSPDDWWLSATQCCRELKGKAPAEFADIIAVGASGMMNGLVLIDKEGAALAPALIHADVRGAAECKALESQLGIKAIFARTANRPDPHLTLPKAMWLIRKEPSIFKRAAYIVQAKDYLVGRLTGVVGLTDPSDACLTGGFDVRQREWVSNLWDAAGVPTRLLPRVAPSTEIVGKITDAAAAETGLKSGIPVVMGGGDGACATAGSGAATGEAYNYLGGTSWIGLRLDQPLPDDRLSAYCALDERVTVFGTVQAAGSSLEWLGQILDLPGEGFADMDEAAHKIPPGSGDLFFLPYLQGERAPVWDVNARGVFFGLCSSHTRAHLFRAAMEGVTFALLSILDVFEENGHPLGSLRLLGGGAQSSLWRDVLAGIFDRELRILQEASSATSLGAAMAAGVGVGAYTSISEAARRMKIQGHVTPNPKLVAAYAPRYAFFQSLYPALKDRFTALAALSQLSSQASHATRVDERELRAIAL